MLELLPLNLSSSHYGFESDFTFFLAIFTFASQFHVHTFLDAIVCPEKRNCDCINIINLSLKKNSVASFLSFFCLYLIELSSMSECDNYDTHSPLQTPGREFLLRVSYLEIYNEVSSISL